MKIKFIFSHWVLLTILSLFIFLHFIFTNRNQWYLPQLLIQKTVMIQGVINSIPEKKFHGLKFKFYVQQLHSKKISTYFLLSWYQHPPNLKIGQRWKLVVKLKPPIGSHNPGGFNYAQFLLSQGISAAGYVVVRDSKNIFLRNDHGYFLKIFRQKVEKQISQAIHDPALAAFISALCVGLRDGLTESDWQVFQKTGTNHLVAIAGLHIGFVFVAIYFFTKFFIRFFPKALLIIPASRFAEIFSLAGALIYATLSGFAIPAERASMMLFCFMITQLWYRRISIGRRLFFAASVILILNPRDLIDTSFWLSFASIGILMWVISGRLRAPNHFISWGRMQMAILIGLFPLILFFFQQISVIAIITNAIAIPWIGFIILPIALLATFIYFLGSDFLSQKLFFLTGKCLLPLWKFLQYTSHLSFASWHHAVLNPFILVAGFIGSIFLLTPRGFPARYWGYFGLLPLFFYHPAYLKPGDFCVTVIDVGQGLSVLVQTTHHVMLYDTGAHFPSGFDYGESVVAPYLRVQGISTIDRLEISHGDNDHSGGAAAIVKDFSVKTIFTSAPKLIKQFHAHYCFAGQSWNWDHVHFTTLNPEKNSPYEDNNSSCVIKISNHMDQILLTGDIQKLIEMTLVKKYGNQLRSTVLLVPHHGSKTSSSPLFLKTVSPLDGIISAGKYNRYHLPAKSVVFRYQTSRIRLYNTANNGAIMIRFQKKGHVRLNSYL